MAKSIGGGRVRWNVTWTQPLQKHQMAMKGPNHYKMTQPLQKHQLAMTVYDIHWVDRGTGTPKDRDEVDTRDV